MRRIRSMLRVALAPMIAGAAIAGAAAPALAASFVATNLVSDDGTAHPAPVIDPALKNAWGMSSSATSPFWVSDNGTGVSTLYSVDPVTQATSKLSLAVSIPGAGSVTGQVFNSGPAGSFNSDLFLFVSEDGAVTGWRSALGTTAETLVSPLPGNVYKGAAFGTIAGNSYLYAADFHSGTIDTYKGSAGAPDLVGSFVDPALPSGYAPFNVQNLNGVLYVTYAVQDTFQTDEVAGPGLGIVDRFDLQGNFLARVGTGGSLNAPWGLAIAPSSFGAMAGDLLVGNFGDGSISIFAPGGTYLGQVLDGGGQPLAIDGLWALSPGNGGSGGSSDLVYFTAGPDGETHGLFGVLTPVPEPQVYALLLAAFAIFVTQRREWRKGVARRP